MILRLRNGRITVVAGDGRNDRSGDGGPATQASLDAPVDVEVDSAGNIYIAEARAIRRVSPTGIITTLLAGHISTGIGLDTAGNILSVSVDNRVYRISPAGVATWIAGSGEYGTGGDGGPATAASLSAPRDVAVDAAGSVFLASFTDVRVIRNGIISTVLRNRGGKRFASFNGQLYVGGDGPVLGLDGVPLNAAAGTELAFAIDASGVVLRARDGLVQRMAGSVPTTIAGASGAFRHSGDGGPARNAHLRLQSDFRVGRPSIAPDNQGNLWISDLGNARLRRVTPDGIIRTVVQNLQAGSLAVPQGSSDVIIGGPAGIQRISATGIVNTLVPAGTLIEGVALKPAIFGIAVDRDGTMFFSDLQSARVFRRSPGGVLSIFAGNGQGGSTGDGSAATLASIVFPAALALDPAGVLYISQAGNIRRVGPDGIITTIVSGLSSITGLAVDPSGVLHFSDGTSVRRVGADRALPVVAGSGPLWVDGDGGPANMAGMFIDGIAFDRSGNLYITDVFRQRIRLVRVQPPSFSVSPPRLVLTPGEERTVTIASDVPGLAFSHRSTTSWVRITPVSGRIPHELTVGTDASGLPPGAHEAVITVTSSVAAPPVQTFQVTLNVPETPAQPRLAVDTTTLNFAAIAGARPLTQLVRVANAGGGTLSFTAQASTTSGGDWLSASIGSQPIATNPGLVTVTARPGALAPGTYQGNLRISGAGQNADLVISMSITAAPRVILLSQSGLRFTAVEQGGRLLAQEFGVLNAGQGTMSWSAAASTLSGGNWLRITPASGTVERPFVDASRVSVSVDASGLAAGEYHGRIQVEAAAANTPQVLSVILHVLPPGSTPGPEIHPTSLIFTGVAGLSPGSRDVLIGNPGRTPVSYTSGSSTRSFTYASANASVSPEEPVILRVFPDYFPLTAGTADAGSITLVFADGTTRSINVLSIVAPVGVTPEQLRGGSLPAVACSSPNLRIQHRALRTGFTATTGQPTTIEVDVADECGNRLGPGATVVAGFSNRDSGINLTHIGNGVWSGTWRPVQRPQSAVVISVTAFATNGATVQRGQADLSGSLSTSTTPTVIAGGVVHAASGKVSPIAPGSLITVYGGSLGEGVSQASALPLPNELNGIQVLLGDRPLPLWYGNQSQLNVQVPFDVPVNTQHPITVKRGPALSVPEQLSVAAAQPGIFTVNQQGTGQAVIVKSDQLTVAQAGTPAAIGEAIVIYCTGLGAVNPAVPTGAPAPPSPLSHTVNTPRVTIGGVEARVMFSGLTPGSAGLYQINAVVPSGITPGSEVPVIIEIGGQASPPVTMAVR